MKTVLIVDDLPANVDVVLGFLAEAGYDYSKLDSEVAGRSYTRNQVYVGVRGTY